MCNSLDPDCESESPIKERESAGHSAFRTLFCRRIPHAVNVALLDFSAAITRSVGCKAPLARKINEIAQAALDFGVQNYQVYRDRQKGMAVC